MADLEMLSANDDLLDLFDPSSFFLDADTSSSDNNSPPLFSDDSSPGSSPPHWSSNYLGVDLPPLPLPEISIDVNPSEIPLFNALDNTGSPNTPQTVPTLPPASSPTLSNADGTSIIKKQVTRSKKRARVAEPLPSPSANAQVALARDQLLSISSKSMDQYVETLSSSRSLSLDEQKELKKQKRLIKNRESAQLSRERKRAYVTQLEDKIQLLVNENNQLKNENNGLRQALSKYQVVPPSSTVVAGIKTEPVADYSKKLDPVQQHQVKMGSLLSIGNKSATAKAGVCLLIVFFTFGLFMNAANNGGNNSSVSRLFSLSKPTRESLPDVAFTERFVPTVGYKRSMLEAFPEVLDEDNDDHNDLTVRSPVPNKVTTEGSSSTAPVHRHIHPIEVQSAGIFKVSYSTKPAQFLPVGNEKDVPNDHDSDNGNRTYMLFLDPRPDLVDTHEHEPNAADTASSTSLVPKDSPPLPPMIISLVVPKDIGKNGSFPLRPSEGVRAEDSLVEITCQVLDVSITTTETSIRP